MIHQNYYLSTYNIQLARKNQRCETQHSSSSDNPNISIQIADANET